MTWLARRRLQRAAAQLVRPYRPHRCCSAHTHQTVPNMYVRPSAARAAAGSRRGRKATEARQQAQQRSRLSPAPTCSVPGAASRLPPSGCHAGWQRAEESSSTCSAQGMHIRAQCTNRTSQKSSTCSFQRTNKQGMHTSMVNRHIQRPSFDGMAVGGCRAAHSHALPSSTTSWSGSSSSQHSTAACHSWLLFPRCAPWGTPCAGTAAACRPQSPTHSACRHRSQMRCMRLPGHMQCCGCRPAGSGSIGNLNSDGLKILPTEPSDTTGANHPPER